MTSGAAAVLAKARLLGVSLFPRNAEGAAGEIAWRGPRGAMTEELKAELATNKSALLAHLQAERDAEIAAAVGLAYQRLGKLYPGGDDVGLPEVGRLLPDLAEVIVRLEWQVDTAAARYRRGDLPSQDFLKDVSAWEEAVVEALGALVATMVGTRCCDCGAEAPVTLLTTLGQRICSRCARGDADAVRRTGRAGRPLP